MCIGTKHTIVLVGFLIGAAIVFLGAFGQNIIGLSEEGGLLTAILGLMVLLLTMAVINARPTKFPKS